MNTLPTEILINIIHYIPDKDLINFFLCCKTFNNVNIILTEGFWLDRGLKVLHLNPNKFARGNMSSIADFTKTSYQFMSNSLRCFVYKVINGERGSPICTGDVVYILKLIKIHDPDNFSKFVISADYFMIPWVQFIANEFAYYEVYIDNLLAIPLAFKYVNRDNILWKIVAKLVTEGNWNGYNKLIVGITDFLNSIILSDNVDCVDLWMILARSHTETPHENSAGTPNETLSILIYPKIVSLSFDKEEICNRVWKHLYQWKSGVSTFLRILEFNNKRGFNNLVNYDKGIEMEGEIFYLSQVPRNSESI